MKDYTVTIEELSHLDFIGIERLLSMDGDKDAIGETMRFWKESISDGSVDRLKVLCGTDVVYGIFSNKYDAASKLASYHIACRCAFDTDPGSFQRIHIYPARYAVLSAVCKSPTTMAQAYERLNILFRHEWLPDTKYYSLIDTNDIVEGTASLELYTPPHVDAEEFTVKIWYPIGYKNP
jgi:predicted transcriptional regulator YdeE